MWLFLKQSLIKFWYKIRKCFDIRWGNTLIWDEKKLWYRIRKYLGIRRVNTLIQQEETLNITWENTFILIWNEEILGNQMRWELHSTGRSFFFQRNTFVKENPDKISINLNDRIIDFSLNICLITSWFRKPKHADCAISRRVMCCAVPPACPETAGGKFGTALSYRTWYLCLHFFF